MSENYYLNFENRFKEVENLEQGIRNNKLDTEKILEVLEDYKWLLKFKPFEELVNTQPVSIEALYDACKAYSRWYGYTQCEMGLQKILFFLMVGAKIWTNAESLEFPG